MKVEELKEIQNNYSEQCSKQLCKTIERIERLRFSKKRLKLNRPAEDAIREINALKSQMKQRDINAHAF